MIKPELIDAIAADSGLAREDTAKAIDSMLAAVTETLRRGEDVTIPGFGKFTTVHRAARPGRNPATGAELEIKSRHRTQVHRGSQPESRRQHHHQPVSGAILHGFE